MLARDITFNQIFHRKVTHPLFENRRLPPYSGSTSLLRLPCQRPRASDKAQLSLIGASQRHKDKALTYTQNWTNGTQLNIFTERQPIRSYYVIKHVTLVFEFRIIPT